MRTLRWTSRAENDLTDIDAYWCGYSTERADDVLETIKAAGEFLGGLPEAGPATEMEDFRKWLVGGTKHILAYRIVADEIEILRVEHASKNWRPL